MADLSGTVNLGVSGTGHTLVDGTQIWANASSSYSEGEFSVQNGADVTAESMVLVFTRLGQGHNNSDTALSGSLTAKNCILHFIGTGGGNSIGGNVNLSMDLEDCTVYRSASSYAFFGNFSPRTTLALFRLLRVNFFGQTNGFLAGLAPFTGAIRSDSSFSDVSFTNGSSGNSARGGLWQTTARAIYNNITFGSYGAFLNGVNNQFLLCRISNQGNTLARANHMGLFSNLDIRAYGQIDNSAYVSYIDVDTGASVAFINWLPGKPASSASYSFNSVFNGQGAGAGGRANVFIGTNPVTTDGGEHKYTFLNSQLDTTASSNVATVQGQNGVVIPTGAWDVNTPPVYSTDKVVANVSNGILFRNQHFERTENVGLGTSQYGTRIAPIADLQTDRAMKKYSYLQQPSNATFGKEITIAVPPNNATDEQVATARAGGYDIFNGTEWETETNVDDPMDTVITALGEAWNSTSKVTALGAVTDQNRTVSEVVALVKSYVWITNVVNSAVDNSNTTLELPYTVSGGEVDFGSFNVVLSSTATAVTMSSTQVTVPCSELNADDVLNTIVTTGTITGLRTGTANIADSSGVSIRINSSLANVLASVYDASGDIQQIGGADSTTLQLTTIVSLPANTDFTLVYKRVGHVFGKLEFNTGNGTTISIINIRNSNIDTDTDISAFANLYSATFYDTATTENGIDFTAGQISFVLDEINLAGRLEESKLILDTALTSQAGLNAFSAYDSDGIGGQFYDIRVSLCLVDTSVFVLSRSNISSVNQLTANEESFFGLPLNNLSGTSIRTSAISNGARINVDGVSTLNSVDAFTLQNVVNDVLSNINVQNAFNDNLLNTQINGTRTVQDELASPQLNRDSVQEILRDELENRIPSQNSFVDKRDLIEDLANPTVNANGGTVNDIPDGVRVTLAEGFDLGVGSFSVSFEDFAERESVKPQDVLELHVTPSVAIVANISIRMIRGVSEENVFHVNDYNLVAGLNQLSLENHLEDTLDDIRAVSIDISPSGNRFPNGLTLDFTRIVITDFTTHYRDSLLTIDSEGTFVSSSEYIYQKANGDKFKCYTQQDTTTLPFHSDENAINEGWTVQYITHLKSVDVDSVGSVPLVDVQVSASQYQAKFEEITNNADGSTQYAFGFESIINTIRSNFSYENESLPTFENGTIPNLNEPNWLQAVIWEPIGDGSTGNLTFILRFASMQERTSFRVTIGSATYTILEGICESPHADLPHLCQHVESSIPNPFSGVALADDYIDYNVVRIADKVLPAYTLGQETQGQTEFNFQEQVVGRLEKKANVNLEHIFRLTGITQSPIGTEGSTGSGGSIILRGAYTPLHAVQYYNSVVDLPEGGTALSTASETRVGTISQVGEIQEFVPIITETFFDITNSRFVAITRKKVPDYLLDMTVITGTNTLKYSEAETFEFLNSNGQFYGYYWSNVTTTEDPSFDVSNGWVTPENVGSSGGGGSALTSNQTTALSRLFLALDEQGKAVSGFDDNFDKEGYKADAFALTANQTTALSRLLLALDEQGQAVSGFDDNFAKGEYKAATFALTTDQQAALSRLLMALNTQGKAVSGFDDNFAKGEFKADVGALATSASIDTITKYHRNRTAYFDDEGNQVTNAGAYLILVYDDDNTTVIRRIRGYDATGANVAFPDAVELREVSS